MSILLCFYVVTKSRADSNHFRVLLGGASEREFLM